MLGRDCAAVSGPLGLERRRRLRPEGPRWAQLGPAPSAWLRLLPRGPAAPSCAAPALLSLSGGGLRTAGLASRGTDANGGSSGRVGDHGHPADRGASRRGLGRFQPRSHWQGRRCGGLRGTCRAEGRPRPAGGRGRSGALCLQPRGAARTWQAYPGGWGRRGEKVGWLPAPQ